MSGFRSWLLSTASRLAERFSAANAALDRPRARFPTALDHRLIQKFATGLGVVALILVGYAYGPVTADRAASAQEPSARAPIPRLVVAQASDSGIKHRIPLPEPADVPPPTSADFDRVLAPEKPADRPIDALIPLPESADVPPLTIGDLEPDVSTTAAVPEPAPLPDATRAAVPESAAPAEPAPSPEDIAKLTGKDLVKAPLSAELAPADVPVAESLRDLLAHRLDRFFARRNERTAVEAFYRDRGFAPLWIESGAPAARTAATIEFLRAVDEDGLDPADYPTPDFRARTEPGALAEAELRLTASVLTFARHAQTGRVHFTRVSGDIEYKLEYPEPSAVLARIAESTDIAATLASHHPPHAAYKALKAKLAEARSHGREPQIIRIPDGPTLRAGMDDPRVPLLRKRLNIPGDPDDFRYDDAVVEAVVEFQRSAGISVDGLAGPQTLRALNGPAHANRVDTILANMERWRWMPRDLGKVYSMVNIPEFTIQVVHNGRTVWRTKTVVGRESRQTPVISTEMRSITVNPTWNVPPGIIANDYLPVLYQDPTALDRIGVRVEENPDGTVRMYQPPGDNNALGRLRFNTPNKYLVYQHDTPDKHLFDRDVRAYSSGCMRVQDPLKYAELLLSVVLPEEKYTQERIVRLYGDHEVNINFPRPIPVHLTYQTASVDAAGKLVIRDDVYGHDARLIALLKGSERRVADIPIERQHVSVPREELRLPDGFRGRYGYRGRYGDYGENPFEEFFRRLFR